tara:strand:- start:1772 stop:2113 length:342 start_codon:yes stop_codon:yes gene_type:complete
MSESISIGSSTGYIWACYTKIITYRLPALASLSGLIASLLHRGGWYWPVLASLSGMPARSFKSAIIGHAKLGGDDLPAIFISSAQIIHLFVALFSGCSGHCCAKNEKGWPELP